MIIGVWDDLGSSFRYWGRLVGFWVVGVFSMFSEGFSYLSGSLVFVFLVRVAMEVHGGIHLSIFYVILHNLSYIMI